MKDPTCPKDSKHYDYFHDPVAKRSLTARQQCSTNGNFVRLVNWMAILVTNAAIALDSPALISAWNTIVAGRIDDGLLFISLLRQRKLTNWDPVAMMNDVLVDAQVAGEGLRNYQAAAPYVCEVYGVRKRDDGALDLLELYDSQSEEVDRRHIEPFYRYTGNGVVIPNAAIILAGIANNHVTLNYVRWQWYQNREPFLEVAYWIGTNPGVPPNVTMEPIFQKYRDPRGNQADRWVIMHFHFDITNRNLFMQDQTTGDVSLTEDWTPLQLFIKKKLRNLQVFIGSNSVRLYHGQRSTMRGRGRRVDNQDNIQNSRSALITCPPGQTFYLGHGAPTNHQPVPGGPTRPLVTFQQELHNLGRSLWDQVMDNIEGLDWVFQGQRLIGANGQPGQYDLTHGQPTVRSRSSYGQPYQDSFSPDGAGGYDMNPTIPP